MSICCFGVTSNTDAAQLAETFVERKCPTKVVGIPVTLNGDLKSQFVETNVGFDTICKFSLEDIHDFPWIIIRLMGRKASRVELECTLQSHPNRVILAEEFAASKLTLIDINVGTFLQGAEIDISELESLFSAAASTPDQDGSGRKNGSRVMRSKPEKVQVYGGKGEQTQRQIHLGGSSQRVDEYVYAELMRQAVGQLQQAADHCNKTRFSHQIFLVETSQVDTGFVKNFVKLRCFCLLLTFVLIHFELPCI